MASENDNEWHQRTPPTDPSKLTEKLEREWARIYGDEYQGKDYPGVRQQDEIDIEHYHDKFANKSASHQQNQLMYMRVLSHYLDKPILGHTDKELNHALKKLQRKKGWATGTRINYSKGLASFLRSHGEYEKADEITIPDAEEDTISPDDVIKWRDHIMPMIEDGCNNSRDRALIASLWESSNRIGTHSALKIKHYETHDDYALLHIPEMDEGDKGASGDVKPLIISRGYIDRWLADHPCPDDDDAALFCKRTNRSIDQPGDHISPRRIHGIHREVAQRAGLDEDVRDNLKPHDMRHSRASYMRASDKYGKDDIETMMSWTEDTVQHSRYEHTTSEEEANRILRKQGIKTEETEEEKIEIECPRCGKTNPAGAGYCPDCSLKLDDSPADWYVVYESIVTWEDDPIIKQYSDIKGATPPIHNLSKSVFERIYYSFFWVWSEQYYDQSGAVAGTDLEWLADIDTSDLAKADYERIEDWITDETLARQYLSASVNYELEGTPLADLSELRELAESMSEQDDDPE